MSLSFVDLDRHFVALEGAVQPEDVALSSYTLARVGTPRTFSWNQLVQHQRVVVLGEPGSGKTLEFRERSRALELAGAYSFFVRLEVLAYNDLQTTLDTSGSNKFDEWKKAKDRAYFFVDSVDEAKFRSIADFNNGLRKLADSIEQRNLSRSYIFLSSRISEWKPHSDRETYRRLFLIDSDKTEPQPSNSEVLQHRDDGPLIVSIQALDRRQVERLASTVVPADVEAFVQDIDRAHAWEFARRPLDVLELAIFWSEYRSIDSFSKLINFDVKNKLKPRDDRDEHDLSPRDALVGAQWLAASSLFAKKFLFHIPDAAYQTDDALDPRSCLPSDWDSRKSRALLNRALFDSPVYGRIRFHHRRTAEYLAAQWIAERVAAGCPIDEIERLLFVSVNQRLLLRPSLRPIAAWLCRGDTQLSERVRRGILKAKPEVHLNYGDAAALPVDYRVSILQGMAEQFRGRKRVWLETQSDSLQRFAHADFAETIGQFLSDQTLAVDFKLELLEVMRYGKLDGCFPNALGILVSEDVPDELRAFAAKAIGNLGQTEFLQELASRVQNLRRIPPRLCSALIQVLYPGTITDSELAHLLSKTEDVREYLLDLPYHLRLHFLQVVKTETAGSLLQELLSLLTTAPYVQHNGTVTEVSRQFYWLGRYLPMILNRLLLKRDLSNAEAEAAARALYVLRQIPDRHGVHSDRDALSELQAHTLRHPRVRQIYFWSCATALRQKRADANAHRVASEFECHEVLQLVSQDFDWLIQDAQELADSFSRTTAFILALVAYYRSGRLRGFRKQLRRLADTDSELMLEYNRERTLRWYWPIVRFWKRNLQKYVSKSWLDRRVREAEEARDALIRRLAYLRNVKQISSGRRVDLLCALVMEALHDNYGHLTIGDWRGLQSRWGKHVAAAVQEGCKNFWRTYRPHFPHERDSSGISNGVIVGINGLQALSDGDPSWLKDFSDEDIHLSVRYAMGELNGFPSWFWSVVETHKQEVLELLGICLRADWQHQLNEESHNTTLFKISAYGDSLRDAVSPIVFELLESDANKNDLLIHYGLEILLKSQELDVERLAKLAMHKVISAMPNEFISQWLRVWIHFDPIPALDHLDWLLKNVEAPDGVVEGLCAALADTDFAELKQIQLCNYLNPQTLRRLVPIVYRHVRIEDDLDRTTGGAYTPTSRDRAQEYRRYLLTILANIDTKDATLCLNELIRLPELQPHVDLIHYYIKQQLSRQVDWPAWSAADIQEFARNHETDPRNDRELYGIGCKRLRELQYDVELSDNSLRDEVLGEWKELQFRRWLARKLSDRSRNRYQVPQEPELDQRERPDLQLVRAGIQPIPIEIKVMHSGWTVQELLNALEQQLLGKYMRDYRTNYGIYVLGMLKERTWRWEDKTVEFRGVVDLLAARAVELASNQPDIGEIAVFGIDFRAQR